MDSFYKGKCILLTGATGFLGKVILEKLLREFQNVESVLLFVRTKKDQQPEQRLFSTVIGSRIWDRLRNEKGSQFDEWIKSKLILIPGDLTQRGLGVEPKHRQLIKDKVQIVIHCAASIDFDEPLDQALGNNVVASAELFELAGECKKLEVYTHISTAYVSCNSRGFVKEALQPLKDGSDIEKIYAKYQSMTPQEIQSQSASILRHNGYPNTYTYTKCFAEHLLLNRRKNTPLVIIRPTIIGSSWREPVEGWIDAVMAAAALYLAGGLGFVKAIPGDYALIGDQIPVDMVASAILTATYVNAHKDNYSIYHVCSSARNPLRWERVIRVILAYWLQYPPKRGVARPKFKFIRNHYNWAAQHFFLYKLPIIAYGAYAETPFGSETQKKKAVLLNKLEAKQSKTVNQLSFFTTNEWIFDDANIYRTYYQLSKEEKERFTFDVTKIDWDKYLRAFCWGLKVYVLKEEGLTHPSNEPEIESVTDFRHPIASAKAKL